MFQNNELFEKNMNIIVGCGRLGSGIATMLSAKGKDVLIIDESEYSFRKLGPEYSGYTIEADGTDIEVLKKADIEKANFLIAATDNDNVNIMVAQIAKKIFNIPLVVARLYDTEKEILVEDENIKAIYPSKLSMLEFEKMITIQEDI